MRDNPQRFIESNTEYSWWQYLNNMSMQGTWCDHMIIQAVADQRHLRIFVIETQEGFGPFNIIQAVSSLQTVTDIY
jgi:exonuclease III